VAVPRLAPGRGRPGHGAERRRAASRCLARTGAVAARQGRAVGQGRGRPGAGRERLATTAAAQADESYRAEVSVTPPRAARCAALRAVAGSPDPATGTDRRSPVLKVETFGLPF